MSEYTMEELDTALAQVLGAPLPGKPSANVNDALQVADLLESKGFTFRLKDLRPKSISENLWGAAFTMGEKVFTAENSQSSVAICRAALAALQKAADGS